MAGAKEDDTDASEFIRRFALHILPKRFVKIRHYGFRQHGSVKIEALQEKLKVKC
jgi:hypothetical protein